MLLRSTRDYDATKREALVGFYKAQKQLERTVKTAGMCLEGATKIKFEELLWQLEAEMFRTGITRGEIK